MQPGITLVNPASSFGRGTMKLWPALFGGSQPALSAALIRARRAAETSGVNSPPSTGEGRRRPRG